MTWTETYLGKSIEFTTPEAADMDIEDIAHALSMQCRYNGHSSLFYSVAQHSVHVAEVLRDADYNKEWQFAGLMHDAHEAYIGDMVTPMKQLPELGKAFAELEEKFEARVRDTFQITMTPIIKSVVRQADLIMLASEARDLMPSKGESWGIPVDPAQLTTVVIPWSQESAKRQFLDYFRHLTK